jgi:hypothetical protein
MTHQTIWWCTGQDIVHCPVPAMSADHWGLERLTIEVLCPLVAPDSPVAHRTVRCVLTSLLWLLTSALCIVHCSLHSTIGRSWPLLHWLTGHVRCTPDSPVSYSGATLTKPESGQFMRMLGLGTGHCPVRHWQHLYLSFALNFEEFPTLFLCWFMLNFMHLR